jgi:hypothetical protein
MKAALAGVAAAAVWQAPRIEGLSVAPDVAQAQSCTNGTATSGQLDAPEFKVGLALDNGFCWGTIVSQGDECTGTRTVDLSIPGNSFAATVELSGFAWANKTQNSGQMAVTVNGIDPPFQSCTFDVAAQGAGSACLPFPDVAFFSDVTNLTFATNGEQNIPSFGCNVAGVTTKLASAFVTVNLTCVCAD